MILHVLYKLRIMYTITLTIYIIFFPFDVFFSSIFVILFLINCSIMSLYCTVYQGRGVIVKEINFPGDFDVTRTLRLHLNANTFSQEYQKNLWILSPWHRFAKLSNHFARCIISPYYCAFVQLMKPFFIEYIILIYIFIWQLFFNVCSLGMTLAVLKPNTNML